MTLNLPVGESRIASYDYSDLAEGVGYIIYYAYQGNQYVTGSEVYGLTTNTFYANPSMGILNNVPVGASFVKVIDTDFDVTFNLPKLIKGKLRVLVPVIHGDDSSGVNHQYLIVRARKYSGTTETELASVQTNTVDLSANAVAYYHYNVEMTIPLTHFKKGDKFRLTIEGWGHVDSGATSTIIIYCDPMNQAVASLLYTYLKAYVPFVIDL